MDYTKKVAVDSPITQQERQGKQDDESKRDSRIADAIHDDRIDAEYQEWPDLNEEPRLSGPSSGVQEFGSSGARIAVSTR